MNNYHQIYYLKNKDKMKENSRKHYKENRDRYNEINKKYYQNFFLRKRNFILGESVSKKDKTSN